jgi:hypothetical protein
LKSSALSPSAPFEVYLALAKEGEVRLEITNEYSGESPHHRIRVGTLPTLSGAGTFNLGDPIYVFGGQTRGKEYTLVFLAVLGLLFASDVLITGLSFTPGLGSAQGRREDDD